MSCAVAVAVAAALCYVRKIAFAVVSAVIWAADASLRPTDSSLRGPEFLSASGFGLRGPGPFTATHGD